jgi:hypothetical protein
MCSAINLSPRFQRVPHNHHQLHQLHQLLLTTPVIVHSRLPATSDEVRAAGNAYAVLPTAPRGQSTPGRVC